MSVRFLALVCSALLFFSLSSFAQPVPPSSPGSVPYPVSTVRNVSTVGASTVGSANVGRYAFAVATGGLVVADASTGLPLPDGKNLPISVRSQIPKATVAGALGRFARKGLPLVSTGFALYDLGQELGFGLDNISGTLVVTTPAPGYCGSAPCYEWSPGTSTFYRTPHAAANAFIGTFQAGCGTVVSVTSVFTTGGGHPSYAANLQCSGQSTPLGPFGMTSRSRAVDTVPQTVPSTVQAFEDAIAAKPSWPPSSALARAMKDAINAGEIVPVHPSTVTGPATTPGPVTTTTDNVNNTTTTSTTTNNHTYSGPNVTTTTTTTNVTVNNTTGAVISSTTVNNQPVMPESSSEEPPVTFSDTALPPLPKLYQPKYPEGLVGVWNSKKSQLEAAPLVDLVGDLMPNIGSGGTCPVWTIPLDFGFFNAGVLDFSVPCFIWDFAKVVIIVSALLLARRLVFGG